MNTDFDDDSGLRFFRGLMIGSVLGLLFWALIITVARYVWLAVAS